MGSKECQDRCENCKFWSPTTDNLSRGDRETVDTVQIYGWCRKHNQRKYQNESCDMYEQRKINIKEWPEWKVWLIFLVTFGLINILLILLFPSIWENLLVHITSVELLVYIVVYIWLFGEKIIRESKLLIYVPWILGAVFLWIRWGPSGFRLEDTESEIALIMIGIYAPLLCIVTGLCFILKYRKFNKSKDKKNDE
ncbi:hypothetical protein ACFL1G_02950 [Planctomycetota bacterium]